VLEQGFIHPRSANLNSRVKLRAMANCPPFLNTEELLSV